MADTLNKRWAEDKNRVGYKLLMKMGWKGDGVGLGKDDQGRVSHVKVAKKVDVQGIGCETDHVGNKALVAQIDGLNEVLENLNKELGVTSSSSSSKKNSKRTRNDSITSVDSIASRTSARRRKHREHKEEEEEEEEEDKEDSNDDDDDDDDHIERRKQKQKTKKNHTSSKLAKKISRAKDVSKYSSSDLKAIFASR